MTSCNVFARAGFYEDASYTLIKVLTAANNAIMAGGDAPVFTAVHVVWHDACGTDTGLWHEHTRSMSAVPVVALNICGATDLETLLEQGNTTSFPAATCNTCGVKVCATLCLGGTCPAYGQLFACTILQVTKRNVRVEVVGQPRLLMFELQRQGIGSNTKDLHRYGATVPQLYRLYVLRVLPSEMVTAYGVCVYADVPGSRSH